VTETNGNITAKFQKDIRTTLNECKQIIDTDSKWRYINLNPGTLVLKGLIKVHKENTLIRPIVNFRNAPTYNLAKMFTNVLEKYIPLPFIYNVQNSVQLMKDLANIPYVPGLRLASLDISNMYTNIPINELLDIMEDTCINNGLEPTLRQEILRITRLIVTQNYLNFQDKTYIKKNGLAMGAPTSSFLLEIFLQYIENTKIADILRSSRIEGYYRYDDDIQRTVYNESHTDIEEVQKSFNDITSGLNFTLEREKDGELNFLDLTLTRKENELSFDIFRKHTTTDTIIPQDSCHPLEQKIAAIRYHVNRIDTYNLDQAKRQKEISTVKFYIYKETKHGNQINDKLTFQTNLIFEAIVQNPPRRGLQTPHINNAH
jgi:hypothetical protein